MKPKAAKKNPSSPAAALSENNNSPEDAAVDGATVAEAGGDVDLGINPGRLCFGLSRIGYTPTSALCDVIDNSVRANAATINVLIRKEHEEFNDSRKNNVREYLIIDDGDGMDDGGIQTALQLGTEGDGYEEHSLAKFGLGMKSAAFSQGDELQVISSKGGGNFNKYVVSLPAIAAKNKYFAQKAGLSADDQELIQKYLPGGKGTIVRIAHVRNVNQPSVKATVDELKMRAGVIYYYFLKDAKTMLVDDEPIPAFDVLFTGEAEANGNLDEHTWDGKTVRWIERPKEVVLDAEHNIKAKIEVTQLVHPPTFNIAEKGGQVKARDKYRIEAGNYGYYVYRNKRLISWAERFGGIIPIDQDFYAFRGRIHIDESGDDCFNIDVKKSVLTLSDEAAKAIDEHSAAYKGKSKKAWVTAKESLNEVLNQNPNAASNEIAAGFQPPVDLPGQPAPTPKTEQESKKRQEEIAQEMEDKIRKAAARRKAEVENRPPAEVEIGEAEIETELKGEVNPAITKIFRVPAIEDNLLWEPYYDAAHGPSVRINALHRFARVVYQDNEKNGDLQVLFELMLLQMAEAEVYCQTKSPAFSRQDIERMVTEYRRVVSEFLAELCRQSEGKLPPLQA